MLGLHGTIFKQAFTLARGHKTFWRLGLLLAWPTVAKAALLVMVLSWGLRDAEGGYGMGGEPAAASPWLGLAVVVGVAVLAVMHFRSAAMLMCAVRHLRDNRQVDERVVGQAEPHTIRLMKSGAAFAILTVAAVAVFSSPGMYLSAQQSSGRAAVLSLLGLLIAAPTVFVIYASSILNPMFLCLLGMPPAHALRATLDMVWRAWPALLAFTILATALEILGMAAAILAGTAVFGLFVLLFRIFYDMYGQFDPGLAQGLAGILGFMVFFMSLAWVSAFRRIAWTVLFLEIARPIQADEQPAEEPLPETAS